MDKKTHLKPLESSRIQSETWDLHGGGVEKKAKTFSVFIKKWEKKLLSPFGRRKKKWNVVNLFRCVCLSANEYNYWVRVSAWMFFFHHMKKFSFRIFIFFSHFLCPLERANKNNLKANQELGVKKCSASLTTSGQIFFHQRIWGNSCKKNSFQFQDFLITAFFRK